MNVKSWIVAPLIVGAALLGACSDGTGTSEAVQKQDPLVMRLVEMGFPRDQIVDAGDHFVVEGDIRFDKKALAAASRTSRPAGVRGQRVLSTISSTRRTVRVNLSAVANENASWASATRAAMSNWNAVPGADITLVEASPADVTVAFDNDANFSSACTAAQGAFPLSGAPGTVVRINRLYTPSYSSAQQVWIMTHELGHNLGLGHTNSGDGSLITGTPSSDAASVMNSGAAYPGCPPSAPAWSSLSSNDEKALRVLYPLPVPGALSAGNSGGQVLLSWSAVSGASYYEYQRYEYTQNGPSGAASAASGWEPVYATSVNTQFDYTGVSYCHYDEATYAIDSWFSWQVRAVFPNGKRSDWSGTDSKAASC